MDDSVGKKLELLMRTRDEDYQKLCKKIHQVNKQLNARMAGLMERLEDLNQKLAKNQST
jgi:hypothetical protein